MAVEGGLRNAYQWLIDILKALFLWLNHQRSQTLPSCSNFNIKDCDLSVKQKLFNSVILQSQVGIEVSAEVARDLLGKPIRVCGVLLCERGK